MAKKPDLSDLASKFDLDKIVGGLKSIINPESAIPDVDPNDAVGMKIAQLSAVFQEMAKTHEALAKEFNNANTILNSLYKDIEKIRTSKNEKPAKPEETEEK